eukprot:360082-Rhodomonas_salina.1
MESATMRRQFCLLRTCRVTCHVISNRPATVARRQIGQPTTSGAPTSVGQHTLPLRSAWPAHIRRGHRTPLARRRIAGADLECDGSFEEVQVPEVDEGGLPALERAPRHASEAELRARCCGCKEDAIASGGGGRRRVLRERRWREEEGGGGGGGGGGGEGEGEGRRRREEE